MTKFCPICGMHNDAAALSCECGRVFTEDIIATQHPRWIEHRQYRKKRLIKKVGALLGAVTIVLFCAAYFGGVFPMQGKADSDDQPGRAIAEEPSAVTQPVAPDPVLPQNNVPYKVFPEPNVPYKATRAITGSVIAVADPSGQERRVTIFGIQVPKLDENFGLESKENLWTIIADKPLLIKRLKFTKEVDTIAEVTIDGSNVGIEQLRSGLALLATEELVGLPSAEQQQYLLAAQSARTGKFGIWSGKSPAAAQSASSMDQPARSDDPLQAEVRRNGTRKRSTGMTYDLPEPVYEEPQAAVPFVSETVNPKEPAAPADVPPKETSPRETPKAVATPPAKGGRKFVRGPYGGCYYINSNGNKTYVDRSKCESQ